MSSSRLESWRQHVRHARRYLLRHPTQTLLSGAGIAFSLLLLTLTQASRRGTYEAVLREFEGLGQNSALLYIHETERLPPRFFAGLQDLSQNHQWRTLPIFEQSLTANAAGAAVQTRALYADPDFAAVFKPHLLGGRLLRAEDSYINRALIGDSLAARLGVTLERPHVKLGDQWFQVCGISDGLQVGGSQIHQFLNISEAALATRPLEGLLQGNLPLKFVLIRTKTQAQLAEIPGRFARFLDENRLGHLRYDLRLPLKQHALAARSQALLLAHGGLVGAVCLVLSCLGILISYQLQLRYRQEEFGTLIALGASPAYLGRRLFWEVLLLVAGSGLLGISLGLLLGPAIAWLSQAALSTDPRDILTAVAVLAGVAAVTAVPPAVSARRFDPIQLMRYHR